VGEGYYNMKHETPVKGVAKQKDKDMLTFENVKQTLIGHFYALAVFIKEPSRS